MLKRYYRKTAMGLLISLAAVSAYGEEDEKKEQTLTDVMAEQTAFGGFVEITRDQKDGSGLIVLRKDQLNKPMLYFASTVNGARDAGHFKGAYRQTKLIEFRQDFDRIQVVTKTPRFYFDPNNPISKAADTNISESVLVSAEIEKQDDERIAIKLADVFMSEELHKVSPNKSSNPEREKARFKPGKLNKDKSRIVAIDSFPKNTHVTVDYVFSNDAPTVRGGNDLSDPRNVTVTLQHVLIEVPENDFMARRDDPRLGFFSQQFDDLTSEQTANYRDVINRWHLVKKDPSAAVSDPVEPITWWIENTTPLEWRDTIRDATLAWNSAFEKAGFSNAIKVEVQPDDAPWSADDIRYNVLRWTSSPRPPFGGYGPSIANPLNGQILGADVMLEYTFMKGRWIAAQMFTDGMDALALDEEAFSEMAMDGHFCSVGFGLQHGLMFGQTAALTDGMGDIEKDKMLRQAMYYLILHEVGHTLGLNHNMRATQMYNAKEIHDDSVTQGILAGSVMDYPSINYAPPGTEQGDFYTEKPGPYDDWAIEYGYSTALTDAASEEVRLQKILSRSTEPALAFGNDADDMRAPGRHIDPRVNIFDQSNDPVAYAKDRYALIRKTWGELKDKTLQEGDTYNDLLVGANVVFSEFARQSDVLSRYVGGVYVDRGFVGQPGAADSPYTPAPKSVQQGAMKTLADNLFAPDAIDSLSDSFAYLQRQRRGFAGSGKNEDPKIHGMLLSAQKRVMDHILHPAVVLRITDSGLYGNEYGLEEVMGDMTGAIFDADAKGSVNSYRRNLQVEYVNRLIAMSGLEKASKYDHIAQASALYELDRIQKLAKSKRGDQATKVHRFFLNDRINRAFHKSRG